ncbi:MAG TPA: phytanoyl-CoA dioxygenase family protein [Acidimicrobiales bacterium]|jgi:ectoine hydroxylase-related dioxygenase (phytanoyl-CoA dioxygenase family)|nr:phytanoyl-CoA dioxygenase family protein [Acidimicrobiales bacterium]
MTTTEDHTFAQASSGTQGRQRVRQLIKEAGLELQVAELELNGYCVVPDAAPMELFDRIREAIVRITQDTFDRGVTPFDFGPNTSMMYRLLAQDDAFVEAVLSPKLIAMMTYLLGEGYVLSVASGSTLSEGSMPGPIHSDNQFFPEPFPPQYQVATAIWCCDEFDGEHGSTHVVPGSHRRFRHPKSGEGLDEAVPVVAPKGSIVIWAGHTWHCSGGRTATGSRVALHTAFTRPHLQVFEAYEPEVVERLVARDNRLTRLVAADLPYNHTGDSPDIMKILAIAATTQAQA